MSDLLHILNDLTRMRVVQETLNSGQTITGWTPDQYAAHVQDHIASLAQPTPVKEG